MKERKKHLDYLDKTFLEELSYKVWVTKGSRFIAHGRLKKTSRWSNICISLFSAYLIMAGLISVYNLDSEGIFNQTVIAYLITSISILLLVFSQVENFKHMELRADNFHQCALKLSRIYNEIRIFKTLQINSTDEDKVLFTKRLADAYEDILSNNENHLDRDFEFFKSSKSDHYEMTKWEVIWISFKYYFLSYFTYHLLILIPPIFFILYFLY